MADDNNVTDSSEVTDANWDSSSQDGQTPFHDHPRFQELISQKNELKESNEALQGRLDSLENRFAPAPTPEDSKPDQYEDPDKWEEYLVSKAVGRIEAKQNAVTAADQAENARIDSEIAKIHETDPEAKPDDISNFAMENWIRNDKWWYDLVKAHALMSKMTWKEQSAQTAQRAQQAPVWPNPTTRSPANNLTQSQLRWMNKGDSLVRWISWHMGW